MIILTQFSILSCSDNAPIDETDTNTDPSAELYAKVLTNISLNVITDTYKDLFENARNLNETTKALEIGNSESLEQVREAWKNTRAPWELSEGFLYGPVDTQGIDPAIDSWPVDVNAINNILESDQEITASLLETNNEARGFHTIEYLIWGLDGEKSATELTERQIEYLVAATQNLEDKTRQLYMGWNPDENNFAENFIKAGQEGSLYRSRKAALEEVGEGMVIIADEVANGKIEVPLNGNNGSAKPEAEESRFSNNSKLDFANNIRSIRNLYKGSLDGSATSGLSAVVSKNDAALDAELETKIEASISAIEAIPGSFTMAIENDREAVAVAQQKVAVLKAMLESKLLPLISGL